MKRRPPENPGQAEFHRPFDTSELSDDPIERDISANETERAALAQRFGLQALEKLSARVVVRRVRDDMFHVSGRFAAVVVQQCVVTLEPVPATIDEPLAMTFVKGKPSRARPAEGVDEDEPDTMEGEVIDLGETVAQQLAISLNPYPRAPGASLEAVLPRQTGAESKEEGRTNPFAALEVLRKTKPQ
jgi:uncharacterized metal-binding protein YceD (DUF177 family)